MTDVAQAFADWLVRHTYGVVLVSSAIDATGFPFPGRILLVTAGGIAAANPDVNVLVVIALSAAGAVLTDHLWYFAAGLGSERMLALYCRIAITPSARECRPRGGDWFQRFGPLTIVAGRFMTVVRLLGWPLARAHGIRYPVFLVFDIIGALLWSATWVGLGWLFGEQVARLASHRLGWLAAAALAIAVLVVLAPRLWRRLRPEASRARTESAAPASHGWPAAPRARPRP